MSSFRLHVPFLAGLAASLCALSAPHAEQPAAAEQEIARLENLYTQSFVTGDANIAERLLPDDFIGFEASAKRSDKAAILAEIKGDGRPAAIKVTSLTIRLHGDTAIALGTEEDTIPNAPKPEHVQWLDTWQKTANGWRLIASAETVPKE